MDIRNITSVRKTDADENQDRYHLMGSADDGQYRTIRSERATFPSTTMHDPKPHSYYEGETDMKKVNYVITYFKGRCFI